MKRNQSRRNKRNNRRRNGGGGGTTRIVPQMGDIVSNVEMVKKWHFRCTTNGAYQFSSSKLCALFSTVNTAILADMHFEHVRIIRIRLWATSDGTTAPEAYINFSGVNYGAVGGNSSKGNMGNGLTQIAYVSHKPDDHSTAGFWQPGANNIGVTELFSLTFAGAVATAELTLAHRASANARTAGTNTFALAAGTVGQTFYAALDNTAGGTLSSGNLWLPPINLQNYV